MAVRRRESTSGPSGLGEARWEAPRQHSLYLPYQALEGDRPRHAPHGFPIQRCLPHGSTERDHPYERVCCAALRGGSQGAEEGFTCAAGEARGEYHQVHTVKLLLHDPRGGGLEETNGVALALEELRQALSTTVLAPMMATVVVGWCSLRCSLIFLR